MGLLRSLVALPAAGPLKGALWLAGKLHETAAAELNDPAALRRALGELEEALEAGEIDEETYDTLEETILTRLRGAA